jgi:TetR/AcrR family transcriptional regulator, tetracycline repressor protein
VAAAKRRVAMPAGVRRAYAELDRAQVVAALHKLARRVGAQHVNIRDLAAELGVDGPALYYHVPGKQAALDLLAESVLAQIPIPKNGAWDVRLVELYCDARAAILSVPGTAGLLENNRGGESARRLDRVSRSLLAEAGLAKAAAAAAHMVVYTYLLGSISLEESGAAAFRDLGKRHAAARFRAGLEVITAGIRVSAVW